MTTCSEQSAHERKQNIGHGLGACCKLHQPSAPTPVSIHSSQEG
jgi:hypothetical protein